MKVIISKKSNIERITREDYKKMLDSGLKFRDWSLYEPEKQPKKTFYIIIDDKGNSMLNKTSV